jgi:hypothetical protein
MEGCGLASRGGNTTLSCVRGRSDSCYPAVGFTVCNISTQSAGKSSEVNKCMMDVMNLITDEFNFQNCHMNWDISYERFCRISNGLLFNSQYACGMLTR